MLPSRIFISYRHADSAAYAGRLYDRLKDRYGDDQVFRDLEMDIGIDFVDRIEDTVGSCAVMVVVIGPGWLDARDDAGQRRLDDAEDYVRVEVSSALRRSIRVIPVLVGEAKMPGRHDLPDALSALARRNALPISDSRWDYDVSRLIEAVNKGLQEREASHAALPSGAPGSAPRERPRPPAAVRGPRPPAHDPMVTASPLRPALIAVGAAALAAVPAYFLVANPLYDQLAHATPWERVLRRALYAGAYWAVIVAAVAAAVAAATRQRAPARAFLNGLVVGALLGALAGGLDQVLTNEVFGRGARVGHKHDTGFLLSLIVLGALLGASGVIGARGLAAAAGGLAGGALGALLADHQVIADRFAVQLMTAVLIVAGIWAAELLRLRITAVAPGAAERRLKLPANADE